MKHLEGSIEEQISAVHNGKTHVLVPSVVGKVILPIINRTNNSNKTNHISVAITFTKEFFDIEVEEPLEEYFAKSEDFTGTFHSFDLYMNSIFLVYVIQ
ncbi:hypothetical protein K502DRAFT_351315 [Neoconidiobolus thromboides FSU 785]|nr:hypothetical protein K502DRAFT_351315 [Neoconidiobolus thromboides FSU 785]